MKQVVGGQKLQNRSMGDRLRILGGDLQPSLLLKHPVEAQRILTITKRVTCNWSRTTWFLGLASSIPVEVIVGALIPGMAPARTQGAASIKWTILQKVAKLIAVKTQGPEGSTLPRLASIRLLRSLRSHLHSGLKLLLIGCQSDLCLQM